MEYDFTHTTAMTSDMDIIDNIHSYPMYQEPSSCFKSTISNNNINNNNSNHAWSSSISNSNTNYQSYYFPPSIDFNNSNQYPSVDDYHFDYPSSSDISTTHLIDPYPNHYFTTDSYTSQAVHNSTLSEASTYITTTESYQSLNPSYTHSNVSVPSTTSAVALQYDYQSTMSQWNLDTMKMPTRDVISTTYSGKQPCLVCHEESSGYHFGAYTCESCKAFYRRVTKDPNIEIKHSCESPLPNITKSNRKDCRACRKDKCDRVGMTIVSKNRVSQTKTTSKSSSMSINNLLEQVAHDLTYNQVSASTALENLLQELDLPPIISINFDCHSVYMNAVQIWRNQYNSFSQLFSHVSLNDSFAVLLFLFYSFMNMKENTENKDMNNIKFDKLVHILQQEINHITGTDHRSACRIKALFMKCYVALAQYYPNSTNSFDSNYNIQSTLSYQQYSNNDQ